MMLTGYSTARNRRAQQRRKFEPRRDSIGAADIADDRAPVVEQRRAIHADAGEGKAIRTIRLDASVAKREITMRVLRRVVDQHQVRVARWLIRQVRKVEIGPDVAVD